MRNRSSGCSGGELVTWQLSSGPLAGTAISGRQVMRLQLVFLATLVSLISCKHESTVQPQTTPANAFQVRFWSQFSKTPVFAFVDGSQVLADTLSNGFILPYAKVVSVQVNQGLHSLSISIPYHASKDTFFVIYDTLYAEVNYDPTRDSIGCFFDRSRLPLIR